MSDQAFHEHHRQLRRGGDNRPVNLLRVGPLVHGWIHDHPAEAQELGWIVSQYDDPADVVVTIPDTVIEKPKQKRKPKASTPEERKARVNFTVRTPKAEENVLPELVELAREKLVPVMGWDDDVPAYFVLTAVLTAFLKGGE